MYIYRRQSSGSQNRREQQPIILRPSQRYYYPDSAQVESGPWELGSYLSELAQPQTLAEQLRKAWPDQQKIFNILRQQKQFPLDSSVKDELKKIFAQVPDGLWLADTLATRGPEPRWSKAQFDARFQRVKSLGTDPGNYAATLSDPTPGIALTDSLKTCTDNLNPSELPKAFFFPGRSDRRALIISGVHGDEKRGVEVVRSLQKLLETESAKGNRPLFTTILVPEVIRRKRLPCTRCPLNVKERYVCGLGMVGSSVVCHEVEPNRNFPLPGEDLSTARGRGAASHQAAELHTFIRDSSGKVTDVRPPRGQCTSIRMLPETRILIDLIDRFQPERLASVHDHSLQQSCHARNGKATRYGGEGPGIFVDPRGIEPRSGLIMDKNLVDKDDQLARRMLEAAGEKLLCRGVILKDAFPPFAGNQAFFPLTVRYFSPQRVEGNSLGDWAPVPTVGRPGIATLTIEVPKYKSAQATAEKQVIDLHRDLLQKIFLEFP